MNNASSYLSASYDIKKCLDFIAETEEQTITNRIAIINTYNMSKVAKNAPHTIKAVDNHVPVVHIKSVELIQA